MNAIFFQLFFFFQLFTAKIVWSLKLIRSPVENLPPPVLKACHLSPHAGLIVKAPLFLSFFWGTQPVSLPLVHTDQLKMVYKQPIKTSCFFSFLFSVVFLFVCFYGFCWVFLLRMVSIHFVAIFHVVVFLILTFLQHLGDSILMQLTGFFFLSSCFVFLWVWYVASCSCYFCAYCICWSCGSIKMKQQISNLVILRDAPIPLFYRTCRV